MSVNQKSKCLTTLTVNSNTKVGPLTIKYDDFTANGYQSSTNWADSFTNSDAVNCPIKKCEIKRTDKDGKLVDYDGDFLKMSTAAPWSITYKSNEAEGYERDFFIECSN